MYKSRIWVLGALDPEMVLIDRVLRECGETVVYAADARGERVTPATAYRGESLITNAGYHPCTSGVTTVYLVECDLLDDEATADFAPWEKKCHPELEGRTVRRIDHHRPGDPGYGRPPEEFFKASSIGQVLAELERLGVALHIPAEAILAAAADHCLPAAYRGECPGVDPDALMRWRAETRAAHQGRSVEELLADVEAAREALSEAPLVALLVCEYHGATSFEPACGSCVRSVVHDLHGRNVPELPEAAAREGVAYLATVVERDGRRKVVLGGHTTPECVRAFMAEWAPAHGLVGVYGDPARGFAGAYMPEAG